MTRNSAADIVVRAALSRADQYRILALPYPVRCQACCLRRCRCLGPDAEPLGRAPQQGHVADRLCRRQQQQLFRDGEDISSFDDGLSSLLAQVDELIAAPIAELLRGRGIRHLTVIPDGWLNVLPVWALPSFSEVAVSFAASAHMVVDAPQSVDLGRDALIVVDPIGDLPAAHAERAAFEVAIASGYPDNAPAAAKMISVVLAEAGMRGMLSGHFAWRSNQDTRTTPEAAGRLGMLQASELARLGSFRARC